MTISVLLSHRHLLLRCPQRPLPPPPASPRQHLAFYPHAHTSVTPQKVAHTARSEVLEPAVQAEGVLPRSRVPAHCSFRSFSAQQQKARESSPLLPGDTYAQVTPRGSSPHIKDGGVQAFVKPKCVSLWNPSGFKNPLGTKHLIWISERSLSREDRALSRLLMDLLEQRKPFHFGLWTSPSSAVEGSRWEHRAHYPGNLSLFLYKIGTIVSTLQDFE